MNASEQQSTSQPTIQSVEQTTCCIVGAGPAGMILALLLARKGIRVLLVEAHADFDREFRGDTVHPSTLSILDEIGLTEPMLQQLHHSRAFSGSIQAGAMRFPLVDFRRLHMKYPFVALIPQKEFLGFLAQEAQRYPTFRLIMNAQVDGLLEEQGVIRGVRYRGRDGWHEIRADLTVGADGRFSRVRRLAGFQPTKSSAPIDVLWFRLPRHPEETEQAMGRVQGRVIFVMLARHDHWQIGYVIPKGSYQQLHAQGLEHFRQTIVKVAPELADRVQVLQDWKQISVLSVEANRLRRWYRPGLLMIGDAAHVMSPVGGTGINYAVQDAVVAANVLATRLKTGRIRAEDLARVQRKRMLPTIAVQTLQNMVQDEVLGRIVRTGKGSGSAKVLRLFTRLPVVRALPMRILLIGLTQVHVR
ncbi:2-polyprenyl-6-methoxyphenol hydroxylase-like FAD-dependent oxidoreductase [Thermosporothrix hazakensis]|uniref:2-polyprenyl-6-methoxyphenol hydroxylase-like FAD-dependent oxidoreductase n=1 Tax=Thermosporothrix hazakensis TaxID=644383 RepID=A0A326U726_THEHA|nr:FAD-dependent oxidoreductase [Thermosporothrix hazakensis]PZW26407.1 2-polyprenyl-6-methoxyphenol hydroxylase-like FAD-dependent oxidoreductase [Thermosporothrix hazakensis]GCE48642.1 monooxygenase [Thermosporothrix hazakensis]